MDKDIVSILQVILNNTLITIEGLQEETNSTKRQVTYRIDKINEILKAEKLPRITLGNNKNIIVEEKTRDALKRILKKDYSKNTYSFSKTERYLYMYLMLFINMEDISINHFIDSLKVSRSTVNLDFKSILPYLKKRGIQVKNNRTKGYYLVGSEIEIRRILIKNIIENLSNEEGTKVLDIFIDEYKLNSYGKTKDVISKLALKNEITFIEDRLVEFCYIFIFLKYRIDSINRVTSENLDLPSISAITFTKEYKFAEELLGLYTIQDTIKSQDLMYISAWILGMSVGNLDEDTSDRLVISDIVNKIMIKFEHLSGVHYIEQQKIFKQLYSHFRPTYYRLLFKLPIYNPLCEKIKEEYGLVYKFVSNAMKDFNYLFGEEIQEEEIAYLTIHFATIFSEGKKANVINKKTALIICSNGVGSSAILYSELKNLFPDFNFLPPIESTKVNDFIGKVDIIFTTNYKMDEIDIKVPVIKASPVMTQREKYKITREVYSQFGDVFFKQPKVDEVMDIIKKYTKITSESLLINELSTYFTQIENFTPKGEEVLMLSDLTNEKLVKLNISADNWEDAIRQSASVLVENNKASEEYIDAMIESTKESGPYIVITKHVALPHARPEAGAKEIAIGIATLKNPVEFGHKDNDPVKYVFCLSAVDNNSHIYAMSELAELLEMDEFYKILDNAKDAKEIINFIKENENK